MQKHGIQARGKRRFRVPPPTAGTIYRLRPTCSIATSPWPRPTRRGWRFHLYRDRGRLVVSGCGNRLVQSQGGGLVDAARHASRSGHRRSGDGLVSTQSRQAGGADLPQRSRQPVCQRGLRKVLEHCSITPSMSRKGNCWDNACSETLFGSLKVERLHGSAFKPSGRPRMKSSRGCSGITKHACTRR
jgi:putative transposase